MSDRSHFTDPQLAEVRRLFVEDGWACSEIAEHFNKSRISVWKALKKMGVRFEGRKRQPKERAERDDVSRFRPETPKQAAMWRELLGAS